MADRTSRSQEDLAGQVHALLLPVIPGGLPRRRVSDWHRCDDFNHRFCGLDAQLRERGWRAIRDTASHRLLGIEKGPRSPRPFTEQQLADDYLPGMRGKIAEAIMAATTGRCCDLHRDGPAGVCCDVNDCGPCCEACPTCPTQHPELAEPLTGDPMPNDKRGGYSGSRPAGEMRPPVHTPSAASTGTVPGYVWRMFDAIATGGPLTFGALAVPDDLRQACDDMLTPTADADGWLSPWSEATLPGGLERAAQIESALRDLLDAADQIHDRWADANGSERNALWRDLWVAADVADAALASGKAGPAPDVRQALADRERYQDDLREIVHALGLGEHARPCSPHEVVQQEVLPAIRQLREAADGGKRPAPDASWTASTRTRRPRRFGPWAR